MERPLSLSEEALLHEVDSGEEHGEMDEDELGDSGEAAVGVEGELVAITLVSAPSTLACGPSSRARNTSTWQPSSSTSRRPVSNELLQTSSCERRENVWLSESAMEGWTDGWQACRGLSVSVESRR